MEAPEEKSASSVKMVDAATAIAIFLMGAVVIWDSRRLGASWGSDGPEPGYFPFYIGLILCVSSLVNFFRAIKDDSGDSFVSMSALKMILSVIVPTIVYVALIGGVGPIPALGSYVASAIFIALLLEKYGRWVDLERDRGSRSRQRQVAQVRRGHLRRHHRRHPARPRRTSHPR